MVDKIPDYPEQLRTMAIQKHKNVIITVDFLISNIQKALNDPCLPDDGRSQLLEQLGSFKRIKRESQSAIKELLEIKLPLWGGHPKQTK